MSPHPVPFHFVDRVLQQLAYMAQEGIIRPNSSPWCAPTVYVPKPNGGKNPKELRSFLGHANFYKNFVPGFANTAAPLNALTSNKSVFSWAPIHHSAFETLRQ